MNAFLDTVLEKNNFFGLKSLFYRNLLARIAVYYCFILEGIYVGVWGRYLPNIQDCIGLSDSLLGTSVLFVYLGQVIVSPLVAFLLRHFGSRTTTVIGAWTFIATLPIISFANSFGLLVFFMFLFGFCMGIMDISMNNSAILTEIVAGKPLLGSFHGSYSVAAALGSVWGGLFISMHLDTMQAFFLLCGIHGAFSVLTFWNMYNQEQEIFLSEYHKDDDRKDLLKPLLLPDANSEEEEQKQLIIQQQFRDTCLNDSPVYYDVDDRGTFIHSYQGVLVLDQNRGTVVEYAVDSLEDGNVNINNRLTMSELVTPDQLFNTKTTKNPLHGDHRKLSNNSTQENTSEQDQHRVQSGDGFSFESLYKARKIIFYFSTVGFLAAWGESATVTWSVVYFDRYIKAASVLQSLGLTSFMICMAIGRFLCDYFRHHFGRRRIIRAGGLLAITGQIIVVLSVDLPVPVFFACLGFAITGFGLSTIIPIVFSSSGHLPGVHAGSALATVACCSYSGSIVSSPAIGLISDSLGSLRTAFLINGFLLGLIFPLSWGIIREVEVFKNKREDNEQES